MQKCGSSDSLKICDSKETFVHKLNLLTSLRVDVKIFDEQQLKACVAWTFLKYSKDYLQHC